MSIETPKTVDLIGIDKENGTVVLTISDHLDWDSDNRHFELLQEKLNSYLAYVESGEFLESYPKAKGRKILITVVGMHDLNPEAQEFFSAVGKIVEQAGAALKFELLRPGKLGDTSGRPNKYK